MSYIVHCTNTCSERPPVIHCVCDISSGVPLGGSSVAQVFTRCTDPNVILDCKPVTPGEPVDVFLKVCLNISFLIDVYDAFWKVL